MNLLVLNAGSSSLKFALYRGEGREPERLLRGQLAGIGRAPAFTLAEGVGSLPDAAGVRDHADAIRLLLDWLSSAGHGEALAGAGHRVVHGGGVYDRPVLVDKTVLDRLAQFEPLAPHHQPHNVAAIRALRATRPELPQVACFDTSFHMTQPQVATRLGLPLALEAEGLRRYGFHGLSYEYVVSALVAEGPLPRRLVIAHLGNGASMCAVKDGRSIATTMGFSTLDGLPMATRSGAVDPGAILYLLRQGMSLAAVEDLLYNRSGLLGLSGSSGDMRGLLASDSAEAAAAVDTFCYRVVRETGSLAAALGGLDAFVFTGGIGENASEVRARVCRDLGWLGVEVRVVHTDEELVIARHTRALIA